MLLQSRHRVYLHLTRYSSTTAKILTPLINGHDIEKSDNVKFLDASWYLSPERHPQDEFYKERLPGAQFFDIDTIANTSTNLPHMLPSAKEFEEQVTAMGISNEDTVVVYGGYNSFSSARCWWMFKVFGHENVHVLNGGITKWKNENREIEKGPPTSPSIHRSKYTASFHPDSVVSWKQVADKLNDSNTFILDARSLSRFMGESPEPREGVRGGHMPGSKCVHFASVVDDKDNSIFLDLNTIEQVFKAAGIDTTNKQQYLFTSCGSGVTACILSFSLHLLGFPLHRVPVYDGSWTEYGSLPHLPVVATSSK